ncbi:hypothetical protein B0T19DRAFT_445404 [Cercophora scortea]|uniref:Uncharacterized protein n=1 Tax=Cercophora scortea TaxID=314031 RepID=A0AAE0I6Z1_9PEZI|nr:hypothetical protein B0T19DRAFT_445404 [Cercophora scortea]
MDSSKKPAHSWSVFEYHTTASLHRDPSGDFGFMYAERAAALKQRYGAHTNVASPLHYAVYKKTVFTAPAREPRSHSQTTKESEHHDAQAVDTGPAPSVPVPPVVAPYVPTSSNPPTSVPHSFMPTPQRTSPPLSLAQQTTTPSGSPPHSEAGTNDNVWTTGFQIYRSMGKYIETIVGSASTSEQRLSSKAIDSALQKIREANDLILDASLQIADAFQANGPKETPELGLDENHAQDTKRDRDDHHPNSNKEASVHLDQKNKDQEAFDPFWDIEENPLQPGRGRIPGAGHDAYSSEPADSTCGITEYGTHQPREPFLIDRRNPEPWVPNVVAHIEAWLFYIDETAVSDPNVGEDARNGGHGESMSTSEDDPDCVDVDDSLSMRGMKSAQGSNPRSLDSKPSYPARDSDLEHSHLDEAHVSLVFSDPSDRDLVDHLSILSPPRDYPEEVDSKVRHVLSWLLRLESDGHASTGSGGHKSVDSGSHHGSTNSVPEVPPSKLPRMRHSASIMTSQNAILAEHDPKYKKHSTIATYNKIEDLLQTENEKTWYFFFHPQLHTPDELAQILDLPHYHKIHAHPACVKGHDLMAVDGRPVVAAAPTPDSVFGEPMVHGWAFEIEDERQEAVIDDHFYKLDEKNAKREVDVAFRFVDGQDTGEIVTGCMFNLQLEIRGREVL